MNESNIWCRMFGTLKICLTKPKVLHLQKLDIGGNFQIPHREVCTDRTGHAEAVEVEYDPEQISYDEFLDVFGIIITLLP